MKHIRELELEKRVNAFGIVMVPEGPEQVWNRKVKKIVRVKMLQSLD